MDKNFLVYLIRHGQTAWSLSGQHTGRTDIPLTQEGEKLALSLQEPLSKIAFGTMYSSPLIRAYKTAQINGFEPLKDDDLMEWDYGNYEGLRTIDIHKTAPQWNLFKEGAPGGESVVAACERADRMIAKIKSSKGPVAIFSHGHFLRVLAARWLKLPAEKGALFSLQTESISILGFEHNIEEPVVKLWNYHSDQ
ncbi:MAG: histidine phosphatase family protein [Chlamydiota bacterium]